MQQPNRLLKKINAVVVIFYHNKPFYFHFNNHCQCPPTDFEFRIFFNQGSPFPRR